MMEDEAQWVTMQLLRGQGGLRGRADTAAAYCTICAFVAMLVSFRALMALTILFLLLLVEGWDENANTQSEHIRHTHRERCIRIETRLSGNGANVGGSSRAIES